VVQRRASFAVQADEEEGPRDACGLLHLGFKELAQAEVVHRVLAIGHIVLIVTIIAIIVLLLIKGRKDGSKGVFKSWASVAKVAILLDKRLQDGNGMANSLVASRFKDLAKENELLFGLC
jgi:hypothetical protein